MRLSYCIESFTNASAPGNMRPRSPGGAPDRLHQRDPDDGGLGAATTADGRSTDVSVLVGAALARAASCSADWLRASKLEQQGEGRSKSKWRRGGGGSGDDGTALLRRLVTLAYGSTHAGPGLQGGHERPSPTAAPAWTGADHNGLWPAPWQPSQGGEDHVIYHDAPTTELIIASLYPPLLNACTGPWDKRRRYRHALYTGRDIAS